VVTAEHVRPLDGQEEYLAQWGRLWGVPVFERRVTVRLSHRLRATAGRCRPGKMEIVLNAVFLAAHPQQYAATLCHEAAHMAVYLLHGPYVKPHGDEWKALVRAAGFPDDVTCRVSEPLQSASKAGATLYLHRCPRCGYTHRARTRQQRWACPTCAVPLEVEAVYLNR
jgi:predicted SprT family Zn-dependent metalloprotease